MSKTYWFIEPLLVLSLKWNQLKDLNVRQETITLLEENMGKNSPIYITAGSSMTHFPE